MSQALFKMKTELFHEITEHLLSEDKPSVYLNIISIQREYQDIPFSYLWQIKNTEQSKKYHPEGSVWNHTMLVVDEAAMVRGKSKDPEAFMWAALLHDIGKPSTTRNRKGKITSYDHDKKGEELCNEFLGFLTTDKEFIERVAALVRYHMHILYLLKGQPYGDVRGLMNRVDRSELALLCRCDRLGRTGADREEVEEEYRAFLQILYKS